MRRLVGGQVWDGACFVPRDLVVDGGRIVDGAHIDVAPRDLGGAWVIPGVVDSHVHLQFSTPAAILAGGVTTMRDLGSPPSAALASVGTTPLRIVAAGRILTPVRGYPSTSWGSDGTAREVRDAEDAVAAVAEQRAAGATWIKVALEESGGQPLFDVEQLEAVVVAAHDAGLRVTAHVGSPRGLGLALQAGLDELCHLPLYDVDEATATAIAEAGCVLIPTLEIRGTDPGAQRAVAAFRAAGGTVVYGTDLGNGGTAPGIEVTEVRAMLGCGMTPVEVLHAMTAGAAAHLRLPGVGTLGVGAAADLVVLRADPLADPAAFGDIVLVLAGGFVVADRL